MVKIIKTITLDANTYYKLMSLGIENFSGLVNDLITNIVNRDNISYGDEKSLKQLEEEVKEREIDLITLKINLKQEVEKMKVLKESEQKKVLETDIKDKSDKRKIYENYISLEPYDKVRYLKAVGLTIREIESYKDL